jgi:hypothetical protein
MCYFINKRQSIAVSFDLIRERIFFIFILNWNQTEVYNSWNYLVFGLCPSSGILKRTQNNTTFRKLDLFSSSGPVSVSKILCFSVLLEYRTMDKVQKPSNAECYTPSSEPIAIYRYITVNTKIELYYSVRMRGIC